MAPETTPENQEAARPDGQVEIKPEVDIAGTQAVPVEGWQKRTEELARPEFFKVSINPSMELLQELSELEKVRLFKKLKLVSQAAQYMAAGMVKGTVKYETDDYELKQWFAHLIGEGADQMCYQMLLFDAWHVLMAKEAAAAAAAGIVGQPVEMATPAESEYIVEQGDGQLQREKDQDRRDRREN